jgi:hypothetical protein
MNLTDVKDVAVIIGTAVATFTLVKAVFEYTRQNAQKRAEHYTYLREEFQKNGRFGEFFALLDNDDPSLASLSFDKKQDLIGFYEDIALAVNSGLLRKEVAHYMFAYYALRCWDSNHFWNDLNRESHYWMIFRHFVQDMKRIQNELTENPPKFNKFRL